MLAGITLLAASLSFASSSGTDQQTSPSTKIQNASQHPAHHRKSHRTRVRGQKTIDNGRVRQIQQALIREHFLKAEPSGKWDATTQDAMRRYQAAQGWQIKTVPDSRALIRLGLGPDQEHLLNPESAMTTAPLTDPGTTSTASASAHSPASARATMSSGSAQVSVPAATMPSDPSH
jgi:peptidoglycan hydrolase-like protein with peptidoglycan-binding domain